jgi:O-antigen ligase
VENALAGAKMDREQIDKWCERGILGLVLTILVFGPVALGGVLTWHFLVLQSLTAAAVALWAVRLWFARKPVLLWPPICWAVVAFAGYAVARYLQTENEYLARLELIRIITYALLFVVVLNNLHGQETTHVIALTLVFAGTLIAAYAIYQFATSSGMVLGRASLYRGRAGGTFYNPNNLAELLELLVPLGLCYVLAGRLSHVAKILVGYASVVMLAGVGVTVSRGGIAAVSVILVVLCMVLLFQRNYRIQAVVLMAVVIGMGVAVAPKIATVKSRFEDLTPADHRADDMRVSIWRAAVRMWEDHLWLGVGPGQFDNRFPEYRPYDVQPHPEWAHNDYLNTLADYGVAGSALVAAAWILLYRGVAKTWKHVRATPDDFARKKSSRFAFMLGTALGLMGILIHSIVEFPLHTPGVAVVVVTLMALLSSQWRFATESFWVNVGGIRKWAVTIVLAAGIGYLGWSGWRGGRECLHLVRASRCPSYSNARIAELKLAWTVDPANSATTYAIAECYRVKSWNGSEHYVDFAKQAMEWFKSGMKLNPWDPFNWLEYGMCLDWIGPDETKEDPEPYYRRAIELDPNGHSTAAYVGWHYAQSGDYAAARTWFERSLWLQPKDNEFPMNYLPIVEQRMLEATTMQP